MLKHLLAVAGQVLAVEHRHVDIVLPHQVGQHLLAFDLGPLPQVAISPEKVEGVVDQPILPARGEFGLEFGEVGPAFMDNDHLPINDGLAGDIEGAGYGGKTLGPVEAVPRKHAFFSGVDMELDAVAVVFDFVNPLCPLGALLFRVASWGMMNPGITGLILFATTQLTKSPPLGGQRRAVYSRFSHESLTPKGHRCSSDFRQCCVAYPENRSGCRSRLPRIGRSQP